MSSSITQEGLDKSLDDLVVKLFKHFDSRFDKIDSDIVKIDKKYDQLISTLCSDVGYRCDACQKFSLLVNFRKEMR